VVWGREDGTSDMRKALGTNILQRAIFLSWGEKEETYAEERKGKR
jgi:hypothetical protein